MLTKTDNSIIVIHDMSGQIQEILLNDNDLADSGFLNLCDFVEESERDNLKVFLSGLKPAIPDVLKTVFINSRKETFQTQIRSIMLPASGKQLIHSEVTLNPNISEGYFVLKPGFTPDHKLNYLFQYTFIPTLLTTYDGEILMANQPARDLMLLSAELPPINVNAFYFNESDRKKHISSLEKNKTLNNIEVKLQNSQGKIIYAVLTSRIINYHEQPLIISNLMDITAQKRIEKKHALTAKRLEITHRKLVNNIKDEKTIAEIATLLNKPLDDNFQLDHVLYLIAKHLKLSQISIHTLDPQYAELSGYWGKDGIHKLRLPQQVALSEVKPVTSILEPGLCKAFSFQQVRPLFPILEGKLDEVMICAIQLGKNVMGFITFFPEINRHWEEAESTWLQMVVKLISRYFEKRSHHLEIQRQQQLLRTITNKISDILLQSDMEGIIQYAGPGWHQYLGYDTESLVGKSAYQFIHTADLERVKGAYQGFHHDVFRNIQFRLLKKDGGYRWCELRIAAIFDHQQNATGFISGGYIIDDRVEAEVALRHNEKKYRTLFEKAPVGILLIDETGHIEEANQEFMEAVENAPKKPVNNLFHKSWLKRSPVFNLVKRSFAEKRSFQGESYLIRDDEQMMFLRFYINPVFIEDSLTYVQTILIDVTRQKNVEQELLKNQKKLQQITTNITDLITEIDDSGRIIYASPSWHTLLGYEPSMVLGLKIQDFLAGITMEQLIENLQKPLNEGKKPLVQYQIRHAGGRLLWFEGGGQFLHDESNQVIGAIFGSSDITDRKQYEEKLLHQNRQLKKANEELDRFVYRASHDLKAPLSSILGLISISGYSEDIHERNNYLNLIEESIHKLERVIGQITSYSQNARLEVAKEKINFNQLMLRASEELSYIENFTKVDIKTTLASSLDFFNDKDRVYSIIKNILSNAIIYRDFKKVENWVTIDVSMNERELLIKISDNGTGIIKEEQERVFKMFHRSSPLSKGSGLGLYIVKETVQKLNGTLKLTSEEGKGSVFIITIPS